MAINLPYIPHVGRRLWISSLRTTTFINTILSIINILSIYTLNHGTILSAPVLLLPGILTCILYAEVCESGVPIKIILGSLNDVHKMICNILKSMLYSVYNRLPVIMTSYSQILGVSTLLYHISHHMLYSSYHNHRESVPRQSRSQHVPSSRSTTLD